VLIHRIGAALLLLLFIYTTLFLNKAKAKKGIKGIKDRKPSLKSFSVMWITRWITQG
jgi:hypothetical protein